MINTSQPTATKGRFVLELSRPLRSLTAYQIQKIDQALNDLGAFGEVRLVKEKGRVRFIEVVVSESLLGPLPDD